MNKAIFFDRDGVINKERSDYVKNIDELELFPEFPQFVKLLNEKNFLIIVITNQSAIARGLLTESTLKKIHEKIQTFVSKIGGHIDGFYHCPHHPDKNCSCRKPKSGLLIQAAKDFDIDLTSSWMIGNNDSDVLAGLNVGCNAEKISDMESLSKIIKKILSKN